jgi:hypothetical protein
MGEPAHEMELAQPQELFDEKMLPVRNDLVDMVRARTFLHAGKPKHTGKIVIREMLNDEELCEAVCTAILAGLSARLVGKRFQLSPKSVANIRDAMEERGELAPVRTRIQRKLDRVTELGLECIEDGLLNGEIPAGSAWIPTLASIDKREQLAVGIVPGTGRTEAAVTVEQVLAEHALAQAALDRKSDAHRTQPPQPQACTPAGTPLDTGLDTAALTLDLAPDAPAGSTARRPGPGAGVGSGPPARAHRGEGPENSNP